jgi:hypothetical protein
MFVALLLMILAILVMLVFTSISIFFTGSLSSLEELTLMENKLYFLLLIGFCLPIRQIF